MEENEIMQPAESAPQEDAESTATAAAEPTDETGEAASALAEAGWACWSGSVDARDDGRSQSVQRYALLGALEDRRGRVNVLLDDSQAVIGYLPQALSQMARAGYTFRLTVETDL